MADHVAVGEIAAQRLVLADCNAAIIASAISAAFIHGRCSKGTTSLGTSCQVSPSNLPERLPFQK
jgi:hypothetical protein